MRKSGRIIVNKCTLFDFILTKLNLHWTLTHIFLCNYISFRFISGTSSAQAQYPNLNLLITSD